MSFNSKMLLIMILIPLSFLLISCKTVLTIKKHEPVDIPGNRLASLPSLKIKLLDVEDKRQGIDDPTLVGKTQKKLKAPKKDLFIDPPCTQLIHEALKAELIRSGHQIVNDNEDVVFKTEIKKFHLMTRALVNDEWDTLSSMDIYLDAKSSKNNKSQILGPYHGGDGEVTFEVPNHGIMKRNLDAALMKLMKDISLDPDLETFLKNNVL